MNDRSKFERAYEALRAGGDIVPPREPGTELSTREESLRELLFENGLSPDVDDDGELFAHYRGWTFSLTAPDEDAEWTSVNCLLGRFDSSDFERVDAVISQINADLKCAQASRSGDVVTVTVGLLTEAEPSPALLHRCFRILLIAVEKLRKRT
jgi:hypothetical protein